jgi:hypothetical protein
MKPIKQTKKPDPRLEALLERIMDNMPGDTIRYNAPSGFVGEAVADPSAYSTTPIKGNPGPSESLLEDIYEFIDPTGISSWDDAKRAYDSYNERVSRNGGNYVMPTFDEFVDVLGVIPAIGKIPKMAGGAVELTRASRNLLPSLMKALDAAGFGLDRTEGYRNQEDNQ